MRGGLVLLPLVLAGCLTLPTLPLDPLGDSPVDLDWASRALPFGTGHNHSDPAQHRGLSTSNMEIVSWNPMETDYHGRTSGGYYCGEVTRGPTGRKIAYSNSFTNDVAFVGVDVTDPANPVKVSEYALPNARVYDLSVTPDGRWVILGLSPTRDAIGRDPERRVGLPALDLRHTPAPACSSAAPPIAGAQIAAAPQDETPYPGGLLLVDVGDPASPRVADFVPQPLLGVHSVHSTVLDNRTLVLASIVNGVHAVSYYSFFEIVDGKLSLLSVYRPPPRGPAQEPIRNGHVDGMIHRHPVTGQILAYLADWDGGLAIVDLADARSPQPIARWQPYRLSDTDAYGDAGNVHHAVPLDVLWDGRHYTIAGQEIVSRPRDSPTGVAWIIDTTDPANPTWVSSWTLPVDVVWSRSLLFSTHYPTVIDRTLFVTMYHGGVWAIDLTDVANPRTVGVFLPDRVPPNPGPAPTGRVGFAPQVLEAFPLEGGLLGLFDGQTGFYAVRFHADRPAPALPEWPLLEPMLT